VNRRLNTVLLALTMLFGLTLLAPQAFAAGQPSELLRYHGDGSSATGAALGSSDKCDVNDDDFEDAVVGAWFWDKAPLGNIGAAYVILGSEDANGGSLNNPTDRNAVRIDGPSTANAFVGFAVGCLGDVNGDGFDDIAISHYTAQKAYVVFGAEDFTAVDLGLLGSRGYEVKGDPVNGGNVGFSLAPVGDLDEDGLDDFGVAEVAADTLSRVNNGRVWVVAGQDDIADVDLTNPGVGQLLLTVDGAYAEERLGQMAAVGDVNGDGTNDFVVGSYTSTPWGTTPIPGAAAVIWGGTTGAVDLANLGNKGFRIFGPTRARDRLGESVSSAGDINGDGLDDLLIGGDGVTNAATGNRNGSAWVVFGSASTKTVYTSAPANDTIDPAADAVNVYTCDNDPGTGTCAVPADQHARGYWIKGAANNDSTGYSVAGIGDVNADGIPDFAIGAYGYDPVNPANPPATMSGAGAVWVVYGKTSTTPQLLSSLGASAGYRIDGLAAGDRQGRQVGRLGDFDGNGTKDFFAGADFAPRPVAPGTPLSQAGEVTIALMGPLNTETQLAPFTAPTEPGGEVDLQATAKTLAAGGHALDQGTVEFTDGGQPVAGCAAVPVVAGAASCEGLEVTRGEHSYVAEFVSADAGRKDSSSEPIEYEVVDSTSTSLESSENPVLVGNPLAFTASVEPENGGDPVESGTVAFEADGQAIDGCESVAVVGGDAPCETTPDAVSEQTVTAVYSGGDFLTGSSADLSQTVLPPLVSSIELEKLPAARASITSDVRLSALVQVDGSVATTGSVTFTLDGIAIPACSDVVVDDDQGTASCTTKVTSRGSHSLGSIYDSGTISIDGSESPAVDHIATDESEISVSTADATVEVGETLKIDSAVSAVSGGAPVNDGRVRVLVDGNCGSDCNTKPVVDGKVSHELTFGKPGTFTVTGEFSKGQFLEDSEAEPLTVTVTEAAIETPVCPGATVTVRKGRFSPDGRTYVSELRASRKASVKVTPRIVFKKRGQVRKVNLKGRSVQVGTALREARFKLTGRLAKSLPARVRMVVVTRATTRGADCVTAVGPVRTSQFIRMKTGN
jgi:hypothetical protein